jgi:hypothetical protein
MLIHYALSSIILHSFLPLVANSFPSTNIIFVYLGLAT